MREPMLTRALLRTLLLATAVALLLGACGGAGTATPSTAEAARVLPEVEGFSYRPAGTAAAPFVDSATATLEDVAEVRILEASVAIRDEEQVLAVAFGFPGASDEQSVDFMARILDRLEDSFQAGSQPTDDGDAFVIRTDQQTVVMGPWGRSGHLVFLFALGPPDVTEEFAGSIINPPEG